MKKIIIPALSLLLLFACSGNKKDKPVTKVERQSSGMSAEDKEIKEWLLGKEWKAENDNAPFSVLKVYSPDSCSFTDGKKHHWTFKNGEFENFGATWPFTRVNDSTFTIYVKPTQKTYTYNLVKNL